MIRLICFIIGLLLFFSDFVLIKAQQVDNTTVYVRDRANLRKAIMQAKPGIKIMLEPGEYEGGLYFSNLKGEPGKPIVIAAADPQKPPIIEGKNECLHLSNVAYVELHNLILTGASGNGVNVDDGGSYDTPSHHIVLHGLKVSDIGPQGNRDGIKLSGLDDFLVEQCVVERWGSRGQGIDMVGCHNGVIKSCVLRFEDDSGFGVQTKGGSRNIRIRRCRFEHAGSRAVNIGGSTGLRFFRPPLQEDKSHAEAKCVVVEGCTFIGSYAPVAFVGVDRAVVRFNTIYRPKRWVLRILQETRAQGFVSCRNGVFTDNIIAFRSDEIKTTVNIGPATASKTFTFARNWWYCLDNPAKSAPALPTPETKSVIGQNPLFCNPEEGNLSLQQDSPANKVGASALPENQPEVED